MSAFKAWATSNGISTAKVDLSPEMGPGLRGMVAAKDVLVRCQRRLSISLSSRLNLCARSTRRGRWDRRCLEPHFPSTHPDA